VNTLLSTDRGTSKKDLAIQRYSVVPLSPNSGLISWVAQCDTLHTLIKEFRDARKILLNIEHRLILQMAPDFELVPVLNKLEAFQNAVALTKGEDLAKVLWLRSKNAEHWLTRRTNYTASLAVMSMVGYILGLGDRHPSNLMLDRLTGKILHIDFGDCFEVAVHREKFPEKIPFRLTRMLVRAMEVSGIEGNFRSCCEAVMSMLRHNDDSVMAMLEAFVYDPLINWRLLPASDASDEQIGRRYALGGDDHPAASLSSSLSGYHPAASLAAPPGEAGSRVVPRQVREPVYHDERALNARALSVLQRVKSKLAGSDVGDKVGVREQVCTLLTEAQNPENLCQLYVGWCPFW